MKIRLGWTIAILWVVAVYSGCGRGEMFDAPRAGEIPKGPGVFTKGEDGAVLYDSKGRGVGAPLTRESSPDPAHKAAVVPSAADFESFEAYRQWKAWREDPQNALEYKEFQEWLEWQRYRRWKQNQTPRP